MNIFFLVTATVDIVHPYIFHPQALFLLEAKRSRARGLAGFISNHFDREDFCADFCVPSLS